MRLYELSAGLEAIYDAIEENGGEIAPEHEKALDRIEGAHTEKLTSICHLIKSETAYAEACKAEAKAMREKAQKAEKKVEWLKSYLLAHKGDAKKAGPFELKTRKSESVVVDDLESLAEEFKQYEPKPKKAEIKRELKAGIAVPGAHLQEKTNLQVV